MGFNKEIFFFPQEFQTKAIRNVRLHQLIKSIYEYSAAIDVTNEKNCIFILSKILSQTTRHNDWNVFCALVLRSKRSEAFCSIITYL